MTFADLLKDSSARMRNPWIWLILVGFYVPGLVTWFPCGGLKGHGCPTVVAWGWLLPHTRRKCLRG